MANVAVLKEKVARARIAARVPSAHTPAFEPLIEEGIAIPNPPGWNETLPLPDRYIVSDNAVLVEMTLPEKVTVDGEIETARQAAKSPARQALENRIIALIKQLETLTGIKLGPANALKVDTFYRAIDSLVLSNPTAAATLTGNISLACGLFLMSDVPWNDLPAKAHPPVATPLPDDPQPVTPISIGG
jgi:hypothetical protein